LFSENTKLVQPDTPIPEIQIDFYNHIRKNWTQEDISEAIFAYDKNILVFLNEYLVAKEKGVKFNFEENVNIEHIMPVSGRNKETIRFDAHIDDEEEFQNIVHKL